MNIQRPVFYSFFIFILLNLIAVNTFAKPVGKAKMVIGKVMLQTVSGESKRFRRGNPVSVGDIIVTNKRGQAQLIMIDGSNISVRPDSQFRIDEFVATGNKAEDKTHYSLLKGGFRSVTGSIGKKNKASFKLTTPVATMGIRGTDFTAKYCNNDCPASAGKNGLFTDVISGGVSLTNDGGTFNLTPKTNGFVGNRDQKPHRIKELPDNLLSPRSKNAKQKKQYPSPEEEFVQIQTYVAPETKDEVINEAMAAGVPTTQIINGASSGGLESEEIVPSVINAGKRHGKELDKLIRPILNSDINTDNVIEDLMATYPDSALDVLTEAFVAGKSDNVRLRAAGRNMGISDQDIRAAEAVGGMFTIPEELKEILEDDKGKSEQNKNSNSIRSRELTPETSTTTGSSPS